MDITKIVAKGRFIYHTNMLDAYNVLNQLGILKDEEAEVKMGYHVIQSFKSDAYLKGYTYEEYLEKLGDEIHKYEES